MKEPQRAQRIREGVFGMCCEFYECRLSFFSNLNAREFKYCGITALAG